MSRRCLRLGVVLFSLLLPPRIAAAQITPPGLGNAQAAAWSATGIKQALDAQRRREYSGYIGVGTSSGRGLNPLANASIFVFNHELHDRFSESWQYSLALSYRRQNTYRGEWELEQLQEFRAYARYSWVVEWERVKLLHTARPELRGFVRPDFGQAEQPLQLRFRFKTQLAAKLDGVGTQRFVAGAEVLAAIAHDRSSDAWGAFGYRESRFSAFYSFQSHGRFVIDLGYMNDLIGAHAPFVDVHYVAFDLIWMDPFSRGHG